MLGLTSPLQATDRTTAALQVRSRSALAVTQWRALLAAGLFSMLLGAALAFGLASERSPSLPAARDGVPSAAAFASLPSAIRGPVSAALGARAPEYRVSASEGGFRALTPMQGLGERFDRSGVALSSGALSLSLSLYSVGYGASTATLGDVAPRASGNRVTYAHAGVSEWYANGPLGLEQGFTFARAPAGDRGGRLALSLAVSGNARSALDSGGRGVTFTHAGSAALHYGQLTATDARGRMLNSRLELRGGALVLSVDTRGARYPVRIDPLVQQAERLRAGDKTSSDLFGFSVALSADGTTALVGAPYDKESGAAWVFVRTGSTWTQQGTGPLTGGEAGGEGPEIECAQEAGGGGEEDLCGFGRSVALSADGNTALIGGPRENEHRGAAWVFTRENGKWSQQSVLSGAEEVGASRFGRSVALSASGDVALIGGGADHANRGAAWAFGRSQSGEWSAQGGKLTGPGEVGEGYFGESVALSGDGALALIGGPGDAGSLGAVWTFTRSGSSWSAPVAKLAGGSEESLVGRFGYSVALSGDGGTALVGARSDAEGTGAAWPFTRSSNEWVQGAKLTGAGETGPAEFGYSVALSGDGATALIGGPRDRARAGGAAWEFVRSAPAWTQVGNKLTGASPAGWFGASVATSSDAKTVLLGGPHDEGRVGAVLPFEERAFPVITGIEPNEGPAAGGTTVTISGIDLGQANAVKFGASSATEFSVNAQGTSITAVSPEGKGTVNVTVTTPLGTSAEEPPADSFRYVRAGSGIRTPTVTSVSPDEGPSTGATTVTIVGANFNEVTAVKFGSAIASFTVNSATSITAVSPPAPAGAVDVTVTTPNGTSRTGPRDQFTFVQTAGGLSGAHAGVLGFGASASATTCKVSLRSKNIAVQAHSRAALRLLRTGTGACSGKLTLRYKVKGKGKRFKLKTIGVGAFSISPGASQVVKIKLNKAGRALLRAKHGRLNASIAIVRLQPTPVLGQSASVRLKVKKAHRTPTKKK